MLAYLQLYTIALGVLTDSIGFLLMVLLLGEPQSHCLLAVLLSDAYKILLASVRFLVKYDPKLGLIDLFYALKNLVAQLEVKQLECTVVLKTTRLLNCDYFVSYSRLRVDWPNFYR